MREKVEQVLHLEARARPAPDRLVGLALGAVGIAEEEPVAVRDVRSEARREQPIAPLLGLAQVHRDAARELAQRAERPQIEDGVRDRGGALPRGAGALLAQGDLGLGSGSLGIGGLMIRWTDPLSTTSMWDGHNLHHTADYALPHGQLIGLVLANLDEHYDLGISYSIRF